MLICSTALSDKGVLRKILMVSDGAVRAGQMCLRPILMRLIFAPLFLGFCSGTNPISVWTEILPRFGFGIKDELLVYFCVFPIGLNHQGLMIF